jgi:tripartite-type tricarboxylate transporter receptor subunit TctC
MKPFQTLMITVLIAIAATSASAQGYPNKPIKLIVSTSAGGITDILARILGHYMTTVTGQPVVIDNRVGASGNLAMDAVAKAPPDGYTLGFANTGNITVNPYLFKSMPFDPLNDLVPVGPTGTVPLFLVINSKVPATNLQEFIAYAKANPDKVNYAGAGTGLTPDLAGGEFVRRAGLDKMVFVPFRGTGPATAAVIGGECSARSFQWGRISSSCATARCACWLRLRPSACPMCRTCRPLPSSAFPGWKPRPGFRYSRRVARRTTSWSSLTAIRVDSMTIPIPKSVSKPPMSIR